MIKALWQRSKESDLKNYLSNIKRLKANSSLLAFIFLCLLLSCSIQQHQNEKVEWNYPPNNLYPTIMKSVIREGGPPSVAVELKPESLEFDCTLRNDSPYYWCGVKGVIKNTDPKLPSKVGTVYQRVVDSKGKKVSEALISRLKKANIPVFLVAPHTFSIDDDGTFGNYMYGIYNRDECMDLWDDYSACPKSVKKLNVFTGKYIRE